MATNTNCPIWGEGYEATATEVWTENKIGKQQAVLIEGSVYSERAGGLYRISEEAFMLLSRSYMTERQKAWLTTWLVDQRRMGIREPYILRETVMSFLNSSTDHSLPLHERTERLLRYVAAKTGTVGTVVSISNNSPEVLAWTESIIWEEVVYLLEYLNHKEMLTHTHSLRGDLQVIVTVDGYTNIEELSTNPDSSQVFVAMWFSDEMEKAYSIGIKPAIESAGYEAMRIDKKPDVNKIDDEILAEIRRSRFLVADMTHGNDGARGGVYFEAGFALGLGIPVLYACRDDKVSELHFDTRQYFHIVWSNPADLCSVLTNRIGAIVGDGPLRRERSVSSGKTSGG